MNGYCPRRNYLLCHLMWWAWPSNSTNLHWLAAKVIDNHITDGLLIMYPRVARVLFGPKMVTLYQQGLEDLENHPLAPHTSTTSHYQFILINRVTDCNNERKKLCMHIQCQLHQSYCGHHLSYHLGFSEVLQQVQTHYYWPNMSFNISTSTTMHKH